MWSHSGKGATERGGEGEKGEAREKYPIEAREAIVGREIASVIA
jgi:hypothetical protein